MTGKRTLRRDKGGYGTEETEVEEWESAQDSIEVSRTASGKTTWSVKCYARTPEEMREKHAAMVRVLKDALREYEGAGD